MRQSCCEADLDVLASAPVLALLKRDVRASAGGTIEQFTGESQCIHSPKDSSSLHCMSMMWSARLCFYEKIFGFRVISDFGERGCAMQAGERQVLLLFKKGGSRSIESPHDGELHVAFAVPASELMSW